MKYLDFSDLLGGDPASLAVLSTYMFDPDYFERCLLRCSALAKARRIIVFVDAGQWTCVLQQEMAARYVNRRYLVVPVHVGTGGVFHPKLHLLMREQGASLLCGSANLTRSGCTSNLELLNCLAVDAQSGATENLPVLLEAFQFFERACKDADPAAAQIALEWLTECEIRTPWLHHAPAGSGLPEARLIHTYDGSIWGVLLAHLAESPPVQLHVISPFYDLDGRLIRRMAAHWPECQIDLTVQQNTTALRLDALGDLLDGQVELFEIYPTNRRLHAKLLHWSTERGHGCLVGSANFTSAAFDARNVETCLILSSPDSLLGALYDGELRRRRLSPDEFSPCMDVEPEPFASDPAMLRIRSAILQGNRMRVTFEQRFDGDLRCALRAPDKAQAKASVAVPARKSGTADIPFSAEQLDGFSGGMVVTLITTVNGERHESTPAWVIQPARLSNESAVHAHAPQHDAIVRTGDGLLDHLQDLEAREGLEAVRAYLNNLNIVFSGGSRHSPRAFRPAIRDPHRSDTPPPWLFEKDRAEGFQEALLNFSERHEKTRLLRHAKRGDLNAIENYLDILLTVTRLLFSYYRRGMKLQAHIIACFLRYTSISAGGIQTDAEVTAGLLRSLCENHRGDPVSMRQTLHESNYLAHVQAVFMIAKLVRREWRPQDGAALAQHLKSQDSALRQAVLCFGLDMPDEHSLARAFEEFGLLKTQEIAELLHAAATGPNDSA
jgi:hypothetical protein